MPWLHKNTIFSSFCIFDRALIIAPSPAPARLPYHADPQGCRFSTHMSSSSAALASPPPVIRLDGVGKTFQLPDGTVFDAVKQVSLDIATGDIYGLIGKSGAGKSTLLRLINLLERPDRGRVLVDGRDLTALTKTQLRDTRQTIGMIFQQFNLLQNASVFDNVAFPLKIHGNHDKKAIAQRVRECLDVVGLAEKIDSYPAQLSGGQKQRVAIARALAPRPQVLLCDEPTSALDTQTTRSVLQTLAEINRRLGVTIVIVTHELSVVQNICRHVAVLEKGELVEEFALGDATATRTSALGQELAKLERRHALLTRIEAEEAAAAAAAPARPDASAAPERQVEAVQ